jgi:hypothetical protein
VGAAEETEVVKVEGMIGPADQGEGVEDIGLVDSIVAELEPVSVEDVEALVETGKAELLDSDTPVDVEVATESEVDAFEAAETSDSSNRYSNVPQPSPS